MSFIRFAINVGKVIGAALVTFVAGLGTTTLLMGGQTLAAGLLGLVAFISALYAVYIYEGVDRRP